MMMSNDGRKGEVPGVGRGDERIGEMGDGGGYLDGSGQAIQGGVG